MVASDGASDDDELHLEENDDEDDELQLEANDGGGGDDDDDNDDDDLQLEENPSDDTDDGPSLELNGTNAVTPDDGEASDGVALEENDAESGPPVTQPATPSVSELKDAGNRAFKLGRYSEACETYSAALAATSSHTDNPERATLLTNRAACALKLHEWAAAINDCTAALSVAAATVDTQTKARFRRATAFAESADYDGARHDLAQLPQADAAVRKLLAKIDSSVRPAPRQLARPGATTSGVSTAPLPESSLPAAAPTRPLDPAAFERARQRRVTCISPTTPERHFFHESSLYRCFQAQTHPHLELIVVDTGATPSPFFSSASFNDPRVKYLYQPQHQTIGEKRNLAIQHASGDIVCHFDDDDLYAPQYVETMVAAMEAEGADFVKLSAWLVHDLQTDATGLFDADSGMPHPQLASLREQFTYTYGFSYLYRRALFPTFSFMDTSWGEDQDILKRVRKAGKKLVLYRDLDGICLHNQHGENCSRSFAQVAISRALLEATPLAQLLDALPDIARALAQRGFTHDGGTYQIDGEKVQVTSEVTGGLYVWSEQLQRHGSDQDVTLQSFTNWLWSGNGFSKERYAKLGLERPTAPESVLKLAADKSGTLKDAPKNQLQAATTYGLEGLRMHEGMQGVHSPGAITNPAAYADPSRKSAPAKPAAVTNGNTDLAKKFNFFGTGAASFGNPTRKFVP